MAQLRDASELGIYSELLREFVSYWNRVFAVAPAEKREGLGILQYDSAGVSIYRVRIGNLQKVGFIGTTFSRLIVEHQFKVGIRRLVGSEKMGLVIYTTPPVTLYGVITSVNRRNGCPSYLLLKEIFPQNAVDLGMMKLGDLVWRHFRRHERRLHWLADWIIYISKANTRCLLEHNPDFDPGRVEVCANSIEPRDVCAVEQVAALRAKHGTHQGAVVIVLVGT